MINEIGLAEIPEELAPCCEIADCEYCNEPDCHAPLKPGESFNYVALSCAVVLVAFLGALWVLS